MFRVTLENGKFATAEVREVFNQGRPEREKWSTRSVGRVIARLGFKPTRLNDNRRGWIWDEKLIERLCRRYGLTPSTPGQTAETEETAVSLGELQQVLNDARAVLEVAGGEMGWLAFQEAMNRRGYHLKQIPELIQPLIDFGHLVRTETTIRLPEAER